LYKLFTAVLIFISSLSVYSDASFKWIWFGGSWEISENKLYEKKINAIRWDYYELINYNTLISNNPIENFSEFRYSINISEPNSSIFKKFTPFEQMTFFSATSPHLSYYYHLFAVKFTGSKKRIEKISFIKSDIKNSTYGYGQKFNFFVKEISSKKINLEYNKTYNIIIKINNPDITVFIDEEEVLKSKIPEKSIAGKFGFSSRNAGIEIGPVKILDKNQEVLFDDDFSQNSIYIPTMKAKKE
jgi:hypothetical protein